MHPLVYLKYLIVLYSLIRSIYNDLKYGKIKNIDTLPFIFIGVLINALILGLTSPDFLSYLMNLMIMFVVVFIFYFLRFFGAGDSKLLWTIGALLGFKFFISVFAYSVLLGGLYEVFLFVKKKQTEGSPFKFLKNTAISFIFLKSPGEKINSKASVKFAVFIFLGVCLGMAFPLVPIIESLKVS